MNSFPSILKQLRKSQQLTQSQLAGALGIGSSTVSMYESGEREPNFTQLRHIAEFFGVDMNTLLGGSSLPPGLMAPPECYTVPLLGTIACGAPILAFQRSGEQVEVPENIKADFALRCKGDSMINARIFDGDIVYIRAQSTVRNGEIAAVLIDDEATLKRVRIFDDHMILQAENPMYEPIILWGEEINNARILGKAVAFYSAVR